MKNVNTIPAKNRYLQVSELGSRLRLSFSSHLMIGNKLIALDGVKRTLLVLEINNDSDVPYIIELNKIASVVIKRGYGSIRPGELMYKRIEDFLKTIDLQFEYRTGRKVFVLPIYNCEKDRLDDLPALERTAKNWQLLLSKMVGFQ